MTEAPAWRVIVGDARQALAELEPGSVQTCLTSPPYYGLRDYGTAEWEGGDPACAHVERRARRDVGRVSTDDRPGNINPTPVDTPLHYRDVCGKCGARRVDAQIGLEPSPDAYAAELVSVFREVRRVLRDDGTVWLNLGDSYAGSWGAQSRPDPGPQGTSTLGGGSMLSARQIAAHPKGTQTGSLKNTPGCKSKDLIGIPWMVAFALRADGWYLRADVVWAKTAPMPESVTDRPTRSHEFVFLLSKSPRYFYDAQAIAEPSVADHDSGNLERKRRSGGRQRDVGSSIPWTRGEQGASAARGANGRPPDRDNPGGGFAQDAATRNARDVWTLGPEPTPEAHFAVMPSELARRCILAGSPSKACAECGAPWARVLESERTAPAQPSGCVKRTDRGLAPTCDHDAETRPSVVLDPFTGAGTSGLVAVRHGRSFLGVELNADYADLARRRIGRETSPLFDASAL